MKVVSTRFIATSGIVILLSCCFIAGCSSDKPASTTPEKPVVQEMNIEQPADDDKVPMH